MKTISRLAAAKAVFSMTCGIIPAATGLQAQSSSPSIPVGWLNAHPTVVQTGTKPTLSWDITYPSVVKDYVDVIAPSTVRAKAELDVEVRVLGNGVTVSTSNGGFNFVNAEAVLSFNGGSYNRIFYGTNLNVQPGTVVWSRSRMRANETLRFGGRYYHNSWGPLFTSSSTQNVRTLVSGDIPPNKIPGYGAPSLESFIRPYLGQDGKVKIGPMDVIVFMELTHTNESAPGYDLQDMVLLVTFKQRN